MPLRGCSETHALVEGIAAVRYRPNVRTDGFRGGCWANAGASIAVVLLTEQKWYGSAGSGVVQTTVVLSTRRGDVGI